MKMDDKFIEENKKLWLFDLEADDENYPRYKLLLKNEKDFKSPSELSSHVLNVLREAVNLNLKK